MSRKKFLKYRLSRTFFTDAKYGTVHNYIYTQEQQADVILRITQKNFCLYDIDGNKISLSEEILYLYRNRWQIELLFKRFKQNFSITTFLFK